MFGRDPYPPPPPPPFIRDRMLSGGFGGKVSIYRPLFKMAFFSKIYTCFEHF